MIRTLEVLHTVAVGLFMYGVLLAALLSGACVVAELLDWRDRCRKARRGRYVADLEDELEDTLDELVIARRRIAVLEARCARLAVDSVWPRP